MSNLIIDGKIFCNVLEDADRNLDSSMSLDKILELKRPSITAIPRGTYEIALDVVSPRFGSKPFYKEVCDGKLPRLLNVKGFDGVLIHAGNTVDDTSGCLLVGQSNNNIQLLNSRDTFKELYKLLKDRHDKGEKITIKIM